MRFPLSFFLGLRFIRKRTFKGIISFVSISSIFGIAIGVMALIIGLSAMNGFEHELKNRILSNVPHVEIEPVEQPFYNWQYTISQVKEITGVLGAFPYINFNGLIENHKKLYAIQLRGILPQEERNLCILPYSIKGHALLHFAIGKHQILLGEGIAKSINVKQGDWITVMIKNENNSEDKLLEPKYIRLQIIGFIKSNGILDYNLALIPLIDAQNYLKMANSVNGIALKIADPFQAKKLISNVSKSLPHYIYIRDWIDTYGYIYHDIQMVRTIMYLSMFLVISVACFNIVSVLIMSVKDKRKDIAVLRTLGASDSLIQNIFIWYGVLISSLGALIGGMIGIFLSLHLTTIMSKLDYITGHPILMGSVYFIDFVPSEVHWIDIFFTLLMVIVLSLIASWYPAKKASNINPSCVLSGFF